MRNENTDMIETRLRSEEAKIRNERIREVRMRSRRALRGIQIMMDKSWTNKEGCRGYPRNNPLIVDDACFNVVNAIFKRPATQCLWMGHEEACTAHALAEGRDDAAQEIDLYSSELASWERIGGLGLFVKDFANKRGKSSHISLRYLSQVLLNRYDFYENTIRKRLDETGHLGEYRKQARCVMLEASELPVPIFRAR